MGEKNTHEMTKRGTTKKTQKVRNCGINHLTLTNKLQGEKRKEEKP